MGERDRWTDQALDRLAGEVDDTKNELLPLKELPAATAEIARGLEDLVETSRDMRRAMERAADLEERRIKGLHRDNRELRKELLGRFDKVDRDHETAAKAVAAATGQPVPAGRTDWKTVLAAISALTVPLAAAIIATGGPG